MKIFRLDHIINTVLVFSVMLVFPLLSGIEFFEPIFVHLKNFELSDINYKEIGGKDIGDAKIILVKSNKLDAMKIDSLLLKLNSGDNMPKVIGIETIYPVDSDSNATLLFNSLKGYNNIVLADSLDKYDSESGNFESKVSFDNNLPAVIPRGYKNLLIGLDKEHFTVRDYYPSYKYKGKTIASFSTQIIKKYDVNAYNALITRDNEIETINYKGGSFSELDYETIMGDAHSVDFKDKIVLIGNYDQENEFTACVLSDLYFTPMNDRYSGKAFPDMYGVEIQANIISMALDKEYYTLVPKVFNYLLAVFFVYMNMVVFTYITVKNKKLYELLNLLIFVVESLGIFYFSGLLYFGYRVEIDFTPVIFAIILSIFAFEGYNESLKPLAINFYYKFFKRGSP